MMGCYLVNITIQSPTYTKLHYTYPRHAARGQCPAPRVSPPVISATYNNLDTALQCQISHWIRIIVAVAGTPESEDTQLSALFFSHIVQVNTTFRSSELQTIYHFSQSYSEHLLQKKLGRRDDSDNFPCLM